MDLLTGTTRVKGLGINCVSWGARRGHSFSMYSFHKSINSSGASGHTSVASWNWMRCAGALQMVSPSFSFLNVRPIWNIFLRSSSTDVSSLPIFSAIWAAVPGNETSKSACSLFRIDFNIFGINSESFCSIISANLLYAFVSVIRFLLLIRFPGKL